MRKITLAQAQAAYPHRFTLEHKPQWAKDQRVDGSYYAPQYSSDAEWYERTYFPGEAGIAPHARHATKQLPDLAARPGSRPTLRGASMNQPAGTAEERAELERIDREIVRWRREIQWRPHQAIKAKLRELRAERQAIEGQIIGADAIHKARSANWLALHWRQVGCPAIAECWRTRRDDHMRIARVLLKGTLAT